MSFINEATQAPRMGVRALHRLTPSPFYMSNRAMEEERGLMDMPQDVLLEIFLNLNLKDQTSFLLVHKEFLEIYSLMEAKQSMFKNKAQNKEAINYLLGIAQGMTGDTRSGCLKIFLGSKLLQANPRLFEEMMWYTIMESLVPMSMLATYFSQALLSSDAQAALRGYYDLVEFATVYEELVSKPELGRRVSEVLASEALQSDLYWFKQMLKLAFDNELVAKKELRQHVTKVLNAEPIREHYYLRVDLLLYAQQINLVSNAQL